MRIDACFDSHVHWAATGEFAQRLRLDQLTSAAQLHALSPEPHHHRGEWLLGFGYDAAAAMSPAPHRRWLDEWRPGEPIVFTARDGHQRWLSTEALRRAGLMNPDVVIPEGGRVERDANGEPTGLISDRAGDLVDRAMPAATPLTVRRDLLAAIRTFNEAGFTHIRDMTCDEAQWNEAVRIDGSGLLTLAVEEFFWLKDAAQTDVILDLARRARAVATTNLRARGIKLFFDGSLGNEGALLSCGYHGRRRGLELWSDDALRDVLARAWSSDLEVAVHAIGDEAGDRVITAAAAVTATGVTGLLHLEHAQILRPETIAKMRGLNVRCHLQPSHWLEDRAWLTDKVGDLAKYAFPWRRLQEAEIAFDFGSDAPIEPPSVARTFRALAESAEAGIPRLLGRPESYMGFQDLSWAPNSFTLFEDLAPRQVVFRGEHLI